MLDGPVPHDLIVRRNADYGENFPVVIDGAPFDLTGYAFELQVRAFGAAPGVALISLGMVTDPTIEGVFIEDPPTAGIFDILIARASIFALPFTNDPVTNAPSQFVYDLNVIAPDGLIDTWLAGNFIVDLGVSE